MYVFNTHIVFTYEKRHFNINTVLFLYLHTTKNIIVRNNIMYMWICMCSHSLIVLLTLGRMSFFVRRKFIWFTQKGKKYIGPVFII